MGTTPSATSHNPLPLLRRKAPIFHGDGRRFKCSVPALNHLSLPLSITGGGRLCPNPFRKAKNMKQPRQILNHWMDAVNSGNLEGLLALYDDTAVLIPTFSNRLLSKPEALREYFSKLCSRDELSIALHEKTLNIQAIAGDVHAMNGIYCWRFAVDDELLSFEARFRYMLDLSRAKPSVHHHSSQIPRMH